MFSPTNTVYTKTLKHSSLHIEYLTILTDLKDSPNFNVMDPLMDETEPNSKCAVTPKL